jgi:hypothetical protein
MFGRVRSRRHCCVRVCYTAARGVARAAAAAARAPHILLGPGAACMFLTHYEINLDQRILDPEICMHVTHACMAGRPAGRRGL